MIGYRAIIAWAGSWLLSCVPSTGQNASLLPPPPPLETTLTTGAEVTRPHGTRSLTPRERMAVDRLLRETVQVRELPLLQSVDVEVHTAARISEHLIEDIEEDEVEETMSMYVALGLLDPELDLMDLLSRVLTEQVVGYYDPGSHLLVIRDDVMTRLAASQTLGDFAGLESIMVVVHEMVHALQDQHHRLGETFDLERDSDATHAFRAVIEGDATLGMLAYLGMESGRTLDSFVGQIDRLRDMSMTAGGGNEQLRAAPAILRETLIGAYAYGLAFVAEAHRRGGWSDVNDLHRRVPQSAEQVIHPEKYFEGEAPESIELPDFAHLDAAGYSDAGEDTLGELEIGCYFGQTSDEVDRGAAAGWSGDRVRLYTRNGVDAGIVWFSSWDSEADAREAEEAARRVVRSLPRDRQIEHAVNRRGTNLLIVRNLAASHQPGILQRFEEFAALRTQ